MPGLKRTEPPIPNRPSLLFTDTTRGDILFAWVCLGFFLIGVVAIFAFWLGPAL